MSARTTSTMQLGLGSTTLFFEAEEPLRFAQQLAEYVAAPRKQRKRATKRSNRRDRNDANATKPDHADGIVVVPKYAIIPSGSRI